MSDGPQGKNGSTAYSPKLIATTPNKAGFSIKTEVQANKKAGTGPRFLCNGPNASFRYAYSAPDLVIIVPSSAYDRAPKIEKSFF